MFLLEIFGACGELHVLHLEFFRRLRRATCISPWNFSAPAASYMYYSLKFFGACGGLHVLPLKFFGASGGLHVLPLEIFWRLRRATCIRPTPWFFRRLRRAICITPWYVPAPATGYLYIYLKFFGDCDGLHVLPLEIFRCLRRAIASVYETQSDTSKDRRVKECVWYDVAKNIDVPF